MRATFRRHYDRHHGWNEGAQASVFLAALILPLVVGAGLFYHNAPVVNRVESATGTNLSSISIATVTSPVVARPTTAPATPEPVLMSVKIESTPTTGAAATPNVVSPSATPLPSTQIPVSVGRVANTGGDGVFLRRTPVLSDRWVAWPDDTLFVLLGNEVEGDGQHWLEVRDPTNDIGWVPAQFINR